MQQPLSWVRVTVAIAALGYGAIATFDVVTGATTRLNRIGELTAASICTAAFAIARRRSRLAATLVVGTVWSELILSLCTAQNVGPALIAFPVLIVASGLLLDRRVADWFGALTTIGMPIAFVVGKQISTGAPSLNSAEIHWLIVALACTLAAFFMTRVALGSYGRLLDTSAAAHRRYRQIFDLNPDALVEIDASGAVLESNARAHDLLGSDGPQLAGRRLADALRDRGLVGSPDIDAGMVRPLSLELRQERQVRLLEVSGAPTGATPGSHLVVLRDVTERHRLQERLGHAQRMETVGQLAGGVAHDFNNLLTVMGGNAELLALSDDAATREAAGEIKAAQQRGVGLTRQLLAFARREVRQPEALDLTRVVSELNRLLQRLLGEQHGLVWSSDGEAPVMADRGQLEQVLVNLVANARDAMPHGGTIEARVRRLERADAARQGSTLDASHQVLLEVADHGVGMSPETRAHIFEPFFTTKPRGRGTGLGLATVHGIVSQSDGSIAVETALGIGTTFRIFFPMATAHEASSPAPPSPHAAPAGGESVLLVEDDVPVAAVAARILADAGYDVTVVHSADEALKRAEGVAFDLLVTDVRLPGLSGPDLAVRLLDRRPELPIIFVSGYFDAEADGAPDSDRLLRKPFTSAQLLERVRAALDGRQRVAAGGG